MAGIRAVLDQVVELLEGAGLHASTDTAKVPAPGVWVHAVNARPATLAGELDVDLHLDLIVPDHDLDTVLAELEQLLDKVLLVVIPDGDVELDKSIELHNNKRLPVWRVPLTITT